MITIVKTIKTHPFTVIFYLIYLLLVLREIQTVHYYRELQKIDPEERLSHMQGSFEVVFAVIYGFTMGAKVIASNKDQMWFYLCMIVFIVVPFIIMVKY